MAIQKIHIGNIVNDGLGDDLRTAFQKVNSNFSELSEQLTVNVVSLGTGSSVVKQKVGNVIEFRSVISGKNIFVDELSDSLQIINTAPDAFTSIDTNSGTVGASSFQEITIQGGIDIDVVASGSVITVDNIRINNNTFTDILSNYDFGPITGDFKNAVQLAISSSNLDFGTVLLPSSLSLDCGRLIEGTED
jgi:uncharacterized protein YkvS